MIVMQTIITRESVVYTVWDGTPNDAAARELWRQEVPFGRTERFAPGGQAFRAAAAKQEEIAAFAATKSV